MSDKHTPGPWFSDVDGFGGNRVGAFGFDTHDGTDILAQVRTPDGVTFEQAKANARLIAAAPEMLDALEKIEQQLDYGQIDVALRIATSAIIKAKDVP